MVIQRPNKKPSQMRAEYEQAQAHRRHVKMALLAVVIVLGVIFYKFVLLVFLDTIAALLVGAGTSYFMYALAVLMWFDGDRK
ncbi:hypothetical protein [Lentilactobacillus kisonensis]|nr:hypothetical protein [Lentilactobacillus kisonensis]